MRHEGGGRVDGVQGFVAVAQQLVEAEEHIFMDGLAAKSPGQGGAGKGNEGAYGLEPEAAECAGGLAIDAQRFNGKRMEGEEA
jgi:hypothetical protein